MFPLHSDIPFIKKDGTRTTLGNITGDIGGITDDIDTLDGRLDDAEDAIGALADCWVIAAHDQKLTLSTADGTKTVTDMLAEANTALRATVIPDGYAYEIVGIIVANGDGTASQTTFDIAFSPNKLLTNLSSYNLRASRIAQTSSGAAITTYSLYLPDATFTSYSVSIASKSIVSSKAYGSEVPSSSATTYIVYNLWKKL